MRRRRNTETKKKKSSGKDQEKDNKNTRKQRRCFVNIRLKCIAAVVLASMPFWPSSDSSARCRWILWCPGGLARIHLQPKVDCSERRLAAIVPSIVLSTLRLQCAAALHRDNYGARILRRRKSATTAHAHLPTGLTPQHSPRTSGNGGCPRLANGLVEL